MLVRRLLMPVVLIVVSGCSRPWNTAHEAIAAMAQATNAADGVVRSSMPHSYDAAEQTVTERAAADVAAGTPHPVDYYMAMWRELVHQWIVAVEALEAVREVLIAAGAAVEIWRDTQEQPVDWDTTCRNIADVLEHAGSALETAGVELPTAWDTVRTMFAPVCTFVAGSVEGAI